MHRNLICLILCCGIVSLMSTSAQAQVVRIQQPIVQQFSAGTTVTVPDRGTALLGGISSGRMHSRQFGPFRRGSIYGQEFQSSTSSVSVYIHDFDAMDRYLLNSAPQSMRRTTASDPSDHWRNQLLSPAPQDPPGSSALQKQRAAETKARTQTRAQRFYELGKQAEQKHATPNIAILHYTAAAKYGSLPAQQRLKELKSGADSVTSKD
ncbi:hypothetical protein Pan153_36320 [Gimesia panareensis]|uniref:Tetratricopeptide repeat protein n=2 Tax=Gimesia panareensis TaxID=2527978 RepID=A0A518FRJ8_9PLAN|nr:hypothetical protein Pan153_36320 [Gimesia panareensis]